jgi:hypothetical protein
MSSTFSQMAAKSKALHRSGNVCLVRYLESVGEVWGGLMHVLFDRPEPSYSVGISRGKAPHVRLVWLVEDLRNDSGTLDDSAQATGISISHLD